MYEWLNSRQKEIVNCLMIRRNREEGEGHDNKTVIRKIRIYLCTGQFR